MKELNEIITRILKQKPSIKRVRGVVTGEVVKDNNAPTGKYKVRITQDQEEIKNIQRATQNGVTINSSSDLTLVDKTHDTSVDVLKPGDTVWVHYWNTPSDGYIAIKNGLSHLWSEADVKPWHRTTTISDAYVIMPYNGME